MDHVIGSHHMFSYVAFGGLFLFSKLFHRDNNFLRCQLVRQQLPCVQKVAEQTFDLPASGKHLPVVHLDVVAIQILRSYFSFLRADSFLIPAALPNLHVHDYKQLKVVTELKSINDNAAK